MTFESAKYLSITSSSMINMITKFQIQENSNKDIIYKIGSETCLIVESFMIIKIQW